MKVSSKPIASVTELKEAAAEASTLLQMIQDRIKSHPGDHEYGKVRFPRGYIRTVNDVSKKLVFINDKNRRNNIFYALMTHDVLRWIVDRTDLYGQAKDMIIKEAVCLLGNVCETLTVFPDVRGLGVGKSFAKRAQRLFEMNVIDLETRDDLLWLWDKRNQEHIHYVSFREWDHYKSDDWKKSVCVFKKLMDSLTAWQTP